MLQAHFARKFAAIKERAHLLEQVSIPYLDGIRIKGLIKACEGDGPTKAKEAFLAEALDVINEVEIRLIKEVVTT